MRWFHCSAGQWAEFGPNWTDPWVYVEAKEIPKEHRNKTHGCLTIDGDVVTFLDPYDDEEDE